ncbi:MAG: magnesium transporter [Burkholderiales bacterium]
MPPSTAQVAKFPDPFETAIEHACMNVPIVAPTASIGDARQSILGRQFERATHIVVCEGPKFAGILRMEDFFAAPTEASVASLMDRDAPTVAIGVDQEVAAWRAVQHGESALAVVDRSGRFAGLIPPDRLLEVMLIEHDEDVSRYGGFLAGTSIARLASEEPVQRRFLHRMPWLLLGLAAALLAADIVGWFEGTLQKHLIFAFFIPSIVYLADAVGTQTETLVVRGLSVGVPIRRIVRNELYTGAAVGVALAVIAYPLIWWRWGDVNVAIVVALALLAACSTATIVAMTLPWLLDRLHLDPAFGSGPLATVIQDLLSIIIYFGLVVALG